jgi:hypothetical protein
MRAVIAFRRRVLIRMHIQRVVRAGLGAGFTADASARVEIDDTVAAREKRRDGTDFHTRRVGAMVAAHDRKKPARVWKCAFFDVFDPRPIDAERHFVFGFAGDRTGMTTNALAVIDNEAVIHINQDFLQNFPLSDFGQTKIKFFRKQ